MRDWTEPEWMGITAHYLGENEMPSEWREYALALKAEGYNPEGAAYRMRQWLKISRST